MKQSLYRYYLVVLLLVVLALNSVDRLALGLVLQEIKATLHLSDTQLGFLSGLAFAFFYSIMGVPIARWADRGNRVIIISAAIAVWGVMVALCGGAATFAQLLLIRVGVAVGEAGCTPAANALIADYFSRAERPRAAGLYMQGINLSLVIGFFVAGWLNEFYGWRAMFILLGIPGVLLGTLVKLTLKEPRLDPAIALAAPPSHGSEEASGSVNDVSTRRVCSTLWSNRTFRQLLCAYSVQSFFSLGIGQWVPVFFIRSFGLSTGVLGTWLAAVGGISGMAGTYLGAEWAFRKARHRESLQLKVMAIANIAFNGLLWALAFLSRNYYVTFGLVGLCILGSAAINGPFFAMIQTLAPVRMRATAIAIVYLFANLVGMGLGPLAVGALSDTLRPLLAENSLRFALLAMCGGILWPSWHMWRASSTITGDLELCADVARNFEVARS